jgi:hypothetical protein
MQTYFFLASYAFSIKALVLVKKIGDPRSGSTGIKIVPGLVNIALKPVGFLTIFSCLISDMNTF